VAVNYNEILEIANDAHNQINILCRVLKQIQEGGVDGGDIGQVNFSSAQKTELKTQYVSAKASLKNLVSQLV